MFCIFIPKVPAIGGNIGNKFKTNSLFLQAYYQLFCFRMTQFSEHIVNQRFRIVYEALEMRRLIKGKSDIAEKLGTYNHVINSILKGKRNVTLDQLYKLFELYGVNANFVFGNSEDIFLEGYGYEQELPVRAWHDRHDNAGRNNITLVPARALAGYATESQDPAFLNALQKFSVPGLEGELIAFEISGDSMLPTITNGDVVICQKLEREEPLRDNQVYIVVTDTIVAKRIQQVKINNRLQSLRLISDNSAVYKPYDVDLQDIRQILKVRCRLTSHAIN